MKRTVRELRIWSKMKHENILPLLGLWIDFYRFPRDDAPSPCAVAPWIDEGDLDTYLQHHPDLPIPDRLTIASTQDIRLITLS